MGTPAHPTLQLCVTANLDLLGFSQHLEASNNDLRTKIGLQAIKRLSRLDKAIDLFLDESKKCKAEYGDRFMTALRQVRINDAIIATLDLWEGPAVTDEEGEGRAAAPNAPTPQDLVDQSTNLMKFVGMFA